MRHHNQYTKARRRWINTVGYSLLSAICAATLVISVAREITVREIAGYIPPVYAANPKKEIIILEEPKTVAQEICDATNGENCQVIYNLCKKESGHWLTKQPPCQKWSVNKNKNGTFDYSWLQINDLHIIGRGKQGTITMDCVYDLACVSQWTNEQIKAGRGHIWVAWDSI